MNVKVLEKEEFEAWDRFLEISKQSSIFQSSVWAQFQEKLAGKSKFWIIAVYKGESIVAGTVVIRNALTKKYSWLNAPRGPIFCDCDKTDMQIYLDAILAKIRDVAKEENAVFFRVSPLFLSKNFKAKIDRDEILQYPEYAKLDPVQYCGFKQGSKSRQPEDSLILNLSQELEELFKGMKQKGRYNIRLADRKEVKCEILKVSDGSRFEKGLDEFYEVLKETTARDGFFCHNKSYYRTMLESLSDSAKLHVARFNNKIIAGLITTHFKDTTIYYYGASSNEYRNLMAPYLLQWNAIKDAKNAGATFYDFFGIAPENAKNHPWAGVTSFKLKFGGLRLNYQKAQEYVFNPLIYRAYKLMKRLK